MRIVRGMKIVIIGATGHIGTYLVPRLVEGGHEVVCVSRGEREPYRMAGAWREVQRVSVDRGREEAEGSFGGKIASLEPDVAVSYTHLTLPTKRIV